MSKKRKNFHYHYAEKFETQQRRSSRGGRKRILAVPPLALFISIVFLMMFGLISISFSVMVTGSGDGSSALERRGFLVDVRSPKLHSEADLNGDFSSALAGTGADSDVASTAATTQFVPGTKVYFSQNGTNWTNDSAKVAAYFMDKSVANDEKVAWTALQTASSSMMTFTVPDAASGRTGWTHVLFARINSSATTPSFDVDWNKTGDLAYDASHNYCKLTGWDAGSFSAAYDPNSTPTATLSKGADINLCSATHSTTITASFSSTDYDLANVSDYSRTPTSGSSIAAITNSNNATFTATAAGTYTVSGKFNYYVKGFSGITKNTTKTVSVTATSCSITPSKNSTSLLIGGTDSVSFTASSHTGNLNITSSNTSVVSVSSATAASGAAITLTGKKPGTTTVNATCPNSGATASISVTVTDASLSLSTQTTPLSLYEGQSGTITASTSGYNTSNVTVSYSWTTSGNVTLTNTTSAAVGVTAKGYNASKPTATVNLRVSYKISGTEVYYKTTSATVTLTAPVLTLSQSSLSLIEGEEASVSATFTNSAFTPSYSWSASNAAVSVSVSDPTTPNVVTIVAEHYSAASSTVTLTITYTDGTNTTFTRTASVSVSLSQLPLTLSPLSIYEGQEGTITPSYGGSPAYTPTAYSWSIPTGNTLVTLSDDDEETVSVRANAYVAAPNNTVTVTLVATYGDLNDFTKTVTCTVTVKQITLNTLATMTKTEGASGTFTASFSSGAPEPAAYGDHPAYQWSSSDVWTADNTKSKLTLSDAQTATVTVKTNKILDSISSDATAHVSLRVYYATGFYKDFTNCGTVTIQPSPYYILGLGKGNTASSKWAATVDRRMEVTGTNSYEVKISFDEVYEHPCGNGTNDATSSDEGFKLYVSSNRNNPSSGTYYEASTTAVLKRSTTYPVDFSNSNGGARYNMGLDVDKIGVYTFTLDTSNSKQNITIEFPMDGVTIYDNITDTAMCTIEVAYDGSLTVAGIRSNPDFQDAEDDLEAIGYVFSEVFEDATGSSSPSPIEHIKDPTKKIYAIFTPESKEFTRGLSPAAKVSGGTGAEGSPYLLPFGATIGVSTAIGGDLTDIDDDIAFKWYTTTDSVSYTEVGSGSSFTGSGIVDTNTAGTKNFTICGRAEIAADVLRKPRVGSYITKTVFYKVSSALTGVTEKLNGTVVSQKIYATPPDLDLSILSEVSLTSKTVNLLKYLTSTQSYSEIVADDLAISLNPSLPNQKASVTAMTTQHNTTTNQDEIVPTTYGGLYGVNYYKFLLVTATSPELVYDTESYVKLRTVVGTNTNTPSRPLYFQNDSGVSLANKRLMIFYYESNVLKYQTAQQVEDNASFADLYRFEVPAYSSESLTNTWDSNVWIAIFNTGDDDYYGLPTYDEEQENVNNRMSFSNLTSLYAKSNAVSVNGYQKMTAGEGGIASSAITVQLGAL